MNGPIAWWAWLLALALTALAVVEAASYTVAVPAAAGAVLAAALAVAATALRHPRAPPPASAPLAVPRSPVRSAFSAGAMGREDIVLLLDRLARKTLDPHLPVRPPQEVARLLRLPPDEWYRYVDHRLRQLEGTA